MRTTRRRGVTLLDLLAVLAVLAILGGLFMPAMQMVRAAAARTKSQNNLKQIALGMINCADTNGGLLPAGRDANGYSGLAHLLPYIEQDPVYRQIDFTAPSGKAPAAVRKARVAVFLSPRDLIEPAADAAGPTNYLLCAGSKVALKANDGVFFQESASRFPASIPDGTSNTVFAGETLRGDGQNKPVTVQRQHVSLKARDLEGGKADTGVRDWKAGENVVGDRCSTWLDGRFLQTTFSATLKFNDDHPDVEYGGDGGRSALRAPDDVILIALGDGSVRGLSARKVSLQVWQAACTAAGGEVSSFDE
jgi:type II secretory pathway pseudopilin PulG